MKELADVLRSHRERNIDYYLKAFDKLEKTGENTFNNAAAYFGCAWMLYRKMYFYAIIASIFQVALTRVLSFVGRTITFFGDTGTGSFIGIIIGFVISIRLFGVYGNRLYYNVVKTRISENYHTLESYQATTLPLALCFAFGHLNWPTHLFTLLLALYFYYNDSSLTSRRDIQKEENENISPEILKQYLNQNTPTSLISKQIPIYLAYLLIAISCIIETACLYFNVTSPLEIGFSVVFPVLA